MSFIFIVWEFWNSTFVFKLIFQDSDSNDSSDEDQDGAPKGILLAPEPKRTVPSKSRQEQLQDLVRM